MTSLALALPEELVEQIAQRAAAILAAEHGPADAGYLDVQGASQFLSCPPSRIYALVSAGRIPVHRDGSRLLFDRQELRGYVDNGGARRP